MKIKKVSIMMKNKAGKFEFSHYVWKVFGDDGKWLEQCDTEDEAKEYVAQQSGHCNETRNLALPDKSHR